jgi:hypothetical protein
MIGKAGNRRTVTTTPTFSVRIKRDQLNSWQPCRDSNWLPPKQATWSGGSRVFVTSGSFRIFVPFHVTLQLGYSTEIYNQSKPF